MIATVRMQHDGEVISLLARQQGLGMPLVEVWLLNISSPHQQYV
ncbi:hypothetical protein [Chroococcidiopsis cubana]|nr:hypothetical protein [Chroococcidiopsis cubana]